MGIKAITIITVCLLFGAVDGAKATVIAVAGGYEVTYGIDMTPGSSNGSDIQNTFIFEWDDSNFNVDYAYTIGGQGNTYISHIIGFAPTSALLIGYGAGIPGVGDEKDHLYTITSSAFAESVFGVKWSVAFPGVTPETRLRHSTMISLLNDAATGDVGALNELTAFVTTEGYQAAFNPAGGFKVVEWTNGQNGGGSIPEPTAITLFAVGLAGLVVNRRRNA